MKPKADKYTYSDWALILVLIMALIEHLAPNPTYGTTIGVAAFSIAARFAMYLNDRFVSDQSWWSTVAPGLILLLAINGMLGLILLYFEFVVPKH